jgi:hypothetical protein
MKMPTDQETENNPVATGLAGLVQSEPISASPVEAAPVQSSDVKLVQVAGLQDDVTVKVGEIDAQAQVVAATRKTADERAREESDALKRQFYEKLSARQEPPKVYVPPPVPERIAENTRLEMEAGRKRVAEFAEQQANRPQPAPPPPSEGTNTAVFRPNDYVPDQKKGQGNVASASARTL